MCTFQNSHKVAIQKHRDCFRAGCKGYNNSNVDSVIMFVLIFTLLQIRIGLYTNIFDFEKAINLCKLVCK